MKIQKFENKNFKIYVVGNLDISKLEYSYISKLRYLFGIWKFENGERSEIEIFRNLKTWKFRKLKTIRLQTFSFVDFLNNALTGEIRLPQYKHRNNLIF